MKKLILLLSLSSLFLSGSAFADATSTPALGGPNPMLVTQVWGLDGFHTPLVSVGTIVTTPWGKDTCQKWEAGSMGCFDISKTNYFINAMTLVFGIR